MANLLITGASGFIGSFLTEKGLELGYNIYAAVRKTSSTKYISDKRIQLIYLELNNTKSMQNEFLQLKQKGVVFDYVIHNAGVTKVIKPSDFHLINNQYTQNLMEALIAADTIPKKFIFMGSLAAFGPGTDASTPVSPQSTPNPVTEYGRSKLAAEQYIFSQNKIPFLIFRPTGVYGPREMDYYDYIKTINSKLEIYIGSNKQQLSFIYVKDLSAVIYKSLDTDIVNKAYFVTDGRGYSTKQFAKIVKQKLNKKTVKLIIPKFLIKIIAILSEQIAAIRKKPSILNRDKYYELTAKNWLCDASKTFKDFNFTPEYDLTRGVNETINWYKENKWL